MDSVQAVVGYDFSISQKCVWGLKQQDDQHYSQLTLEVSGALDADQLREALRAVVAKHESLTVRCLPATASVFPLQVFTEEAEVDFHQLADQPEPAAESLTRARLCLDYPYDPVHSRPMRCCLVRVAAERHLLLVRLYALSADSYSSWLFQRELAQQYAGTASEAGDMIAYRDFSQWQNDLLAEPDEEGTRFWQQYTYSYRENALPFGHPRAAGFSPRVGQVARLAGEEYARFGEWAAGLHASPSALLLSLFGMYLSSFTASEVTVGYVPFARSYKELAATLGLVARALPVQCSPAATLPEALAQVSACVEEVRSWEDYFYPASPSPLPYGFEYVEGPSAGAFQLTDFYSVTGPFSLKLFCVDYGDSLALELYYNADKFTAADARIMCAQLSHRLRAALEPGRGAGAVSEAEHALMQTAAPAAATYATSRTVLDLLAEQVAAHPEALAVVYGPHRLTYAKLQARADQLAQHLRSTCQVRPGDMVGLLLERSAELVVAMLAVLKAGAAYVPIDPDYPQERIAFILGDCRAQLLLTDPDAAFAAGAGIPTLAIGPNQPYAQPDLAPALPPVGADGPAYVIYTSGSTGTPKGCLISHRNLSNYIQWANGYYFPDASQGNWGLITSLSFDLTVTSLYCSLTRGKTLYVGDREADILELLQQSFTHPHLDTLKLTPAHLNLLKGLVIPATAVRTVICGGEQLTPEQVKTLWDIEPGIRIYNEYGPTETTVGAIVKELAPTDERILIGRPIGNTQAYLLDDDLRPVPVGMLGELHLGGAGVGGGYLNRLALTAEKFIPNPVAPQETVYKTGDLARWLPDGNLEFVSRKDNQVKIRGYRIELGEVESALNGHPSVLAAAVLATPAAEGNELTAYVVWKQKPEAAALQAHLPRTLPTYMLPTHYVFLDAFPLTSNGKVDRARLPATASAAARAYVAPRTTTEARLAAIWQEVLGQEQVGAEDNFLESGGHSLKATRLANLIHKEFEVRVPLKDLFAAPQLAEQARLLDRLGKTAFARIAPLAPQPDYALSSSQRRLWVLSQLEEGNVAYNMPGVLVFEGALDVAGLGYALGQLLERHEILRTVFQETAAGEVRQAIQPLAAFANLLRCHDLRAAAQPAATARVAVEAALAQPFDLARGPLVRAELLQVADDRWVFAYVMHHIISDGWSMEILVKELLHLYHAHCQQLDPALRPLPIQYKDYAAWQQQQLSGEALQAQQAYWLAQLAGELPVLELPTDKVRPALKTYNGGIVHKKLDAGTVQAFGGLVQEQGGTLFMGLLAAVNALLYRYTHQEDLLVGSPVAGREHADLQDQIGFYINTLVLRSRFRGSDSYVALLEHAKQVTFGALEHQLYPFDELVGALKLQRDVSRSVLFDVMLVLQNEAQQNALEPQVLPGVAVLPFEQGAQTRQHKFDLTFNFSEADGELRLGLEYNRDLFHCATAERLADHFAQLLAAIVQAPSTPVQDLVYLSEPEQELLLTTFNNTAAPYPRDQSVVDLFEAQVTTAPGHLALVCEGRQLTYSALNELSNRFAHYLLAQHALRADDLVGVLLDRSEWMVVAILGILKAGAAYVPIDPEYPRERIAYIVEDSQCKLLVDQAALASFRAQAGQYPATNPDVADTAHDLAYVIYTSGTTGNPKGVLIERGSLAARVHYYQRMYTLTAADHLLFYRSYSFDGSIEEYLLPVLVGATCFIAPPDFKLDLLANLVRFIAAHQITKVNMPPVLLGELVQLADADLLPQLASLKHVVSGGDKLTLLIITSYLARFPATLYNSYGPTENTIDSTNWVVAGTPVVVPIGPPVPNSRAFVLDERQHLLPIGVPGELYVSGDGLARGYLRQPQLTAEKFVANPHRPGERMYKTGDLVRWLPDGNLEFIGRKDDQVKIRGFRIELGEIEAALHLHPLVTGATVVARAGAGGGEKSLVAYVVAQPDLSAAELRAFLAQSLPAYMLPQHYVQLAAMPMTAHGKTDRKALPDPASAGLGTGVVYEAARTQAEQQLIGVLEEVLKHAPISRQDDFFALGGDSIKSIQIVSRLRQQGLALSIRDILVHPVVEELATYLHPVQRASEQALVVGPVPLGPVQASFFERGTADLHHYNQSVLLQSREPLDEAGIRAVLDAILLHHDALRMRFRPTPQGWTQENQPAGQPCALEVFAGADEAAFAAHCERLQSGLHLEDGPLLRAGLFRFPQADRLLLVVHHLVVDGVSWRILLEDFSSLYQQHVTQAPARLPQKTDSFRYWQEQQLAHAQSPVLLQEAPYWAALAALPIEPLPLDKPQGRNTVQDAAAASFLLDAATTTRLLTQCHAAYRTEINDVLLTALGLALHQAFGLNRVGLNLEGHGRESLGTDVDVTRTVGWFTTVYPVVLDLLHGHDPVRQLIAVKEHLHRIPNKGIGFGILRYLAGQAYPSAPQITFNYLGDFGAGVATDDGTAMFAFSGAPRGHETGPGWQRESVLDVGALVVEGQLRLSISYSREQYEGGTIDRLAAAYQTHLLALIEELAGTPQPRATPVDFTWPHMSVEQLLGWQHGATAEDVYPLSALQEGFFFHWLSRPGAPVYFEQTSYRVKAQLAADLLEQSYQRLVARHAALRTIFTQDLSDQPLQVVLRKAPPAFRYRTLASAPAPEAAVAAYKEADRAEGFDLRAEVPMRLTVLEVGPGEYEFIWSHHHILMDGWCGSILIKEFFQLYYGLRAGQLPALPPVRPYASYIAWLGQRDQPATARYWAQYLAGYDTVRALPRQPTAPAAPAPHQLEYALAGPLRQRLRAYCAAQGLTENTFIQTAWGLLLSKYTNAEDVVFGAVVSGRPAELAGVEDMIGLFINTIPVRVQAPATATVAHVLQQVQRAAIAGLEHHYAQLADVQSASALGQHLFDHVLVFENYPVQQLVENSLSQGGDARELTLVSAEVFEQSNYAFSLLVAPGAEALTFQFRYDAAQFAEAQMRSLQAHLGAIIEAMVANPEEQVRALRYLSAAEQHQQLVDLQGRPAAYPVDQTLTALFEAQAAATPAQPALVCGETTLTYQQLMEQANRLAQFLRQRHEVGTGDLIGLQLERNEWLVVAMLAVLKAGAAYVPVDFDYPQERIDYIIEDSRCKLVVTADVLRAFAENTHPFEPANPDFGSQANAPAYVIYTSGSTGQPKGVVISHAAIINTIWGQRELFEVQPNERHLQFASPAFDASVSEIFVALLSGCTLYMVSESLKRSPTLFEEYLTAHQIDFGTIPPVYLKLLEVKQLPRLKRLVTAGEAAVAKTALAFASTGVYFNAYGPTETSICASVYKLAPSVPETTQNIPIGVPLPNVQVYVTDDYQNLLPLGSAGELCVGGAGLAQGYLHKPALTAEKFVASPFRSGERLYRTGDLGRWLPDGTLEFVGRKDDQVKIRGHRVELGEVEAALLQHPAVTAAVVTARADAQGEQYLAAYLTGGTELAVPAVRAYLGGKLPTFMLPAHYVLLEALPVTAHGKVDRRRLPDPATGDAAGGRAYVPPRTELEAEMVQIWQDILGREHIGIHDNFFETGGNSIKIIRLAKAVGRLLGQEISVAVLFQYASIGELVGYLTEAPAAFEEEALDKEGLLADLDKFNFDSDDFN